MMSVPQIVAHFDGVKQCILPALLAGEPVCVINFRYIAAAVKAAGRKGLSAEAPQSDSTTWVPILLWTVLVLAMSLLSK